MGEDYELRHLFWYRAISGAVVAAVSLFVAAAPYLSANAMPLGNESYYILQALGSTDGYRPIEPLATSTPKVTVSSVTTVSSSTLAIASLKKQIVSLSAELKSLLAAHDAAARAAFSAASTVASSSPARILSLGSRGSNVSELQTILQQRGFLKQSSITGYFGPATQAAVQAFQVANNIVLSGTPRSTGFGAVGPKTWAALHGGAAGAAAATSSAIVQQASSTGPVIPPASAGNTASSTTNVASDTTPPTVSISSPNSSSTLGGGAITLTASAYDSVAVSNVRFYLNSTPITQPLSSSPYSTTWDPSGTSDGSYTLSAVAEDTSGNYSTTSIGITLDDTPPAISNGSPNSALASGSGSATVSVTTNENATCRYATGANTSFSSGTPFTTTGATSHSTQVSGLADGNSYTYYVRCQDAVGNVDTSDFVITFSVMTPSSPSVTFTSPQTGDTVSGGSVTLTASASDSKAVSSVQFEVGQNNIGLAIGGSPYTTTWDSTGVADGVYTLYAVVLNSSGLYATSTISVTVDNSSVSP